MTWDVKGMEEGLLKHRRLTLVGCVSGHMGLEKGGKMRKATPATSHSKRDKADVTSSHVGLNLEGKSGLVSNLGIINMVSV